MIEKSLLPGQHCLCFASLTVRLLSTLLVLLLACAGLLAKPVQAAQEFLEPDRAFRLSLRVVEQGAAKEVQVRFAIADGYYMYRDSFGFAVDPPALLGAPTLPAAGIKFDQTFQKDVAYYRESVLIRMPLLNDARPLALSVTSQGCADAGLCYSPQVTRIALDAIGETGQWIGAGGSPTSAGSLGNLRALLEGDVFQLADILEKARLSVTLALFFGFGLLLAFTPCVLPMMPILSSIIVGQGVSLNRRHGVTLAAAYVLGMAVVYTFMGVAAGLAGEGLAAYLQNIWVIGASALLLVVLAGAMLGLYTFQMPPAIQTWVMHRTARIPGGNHVGVFGMGAMSALIVGPCVAAPLAGALIYIGQTGDATLGAAALFAMALGMGTPLLFIGFSAGALLPRVGRWMDSIRRFFGIALIAVALWLISPFLPTWLTHLSGAVLLAWAILALKLWPRAGRGGSPVVRRVATVMTLMVAVAWGLASILPAIDNRPDARPHADRTRYDAPFLYNLRTSRRKNPALRGDQD